MPRNEYFEEFKRVLCENSVHKDNYEQAKYEWVVAGGHNDHQHKHDSLGRFTFEYYMMHFKHKFKQPKYTTYCICTHDIEQNCYIYNNLNKKALVVGNCCVCNFLPNSKKTCELCREPHKRRIKNVCVNCERAGNKKFKRGLHKGRKLLDVVKSKPSYIVWCFENGQSVFPENTLDFVTMCCNQIKSQQRKAEITKWFEKHNTASIMLQD